MSFRYVEENYSNICFLIMLYFKLDVDFKYSIFVLIYIICKNYYC